MLIKSNPAYLLYQTNKGMKKQAEQTSTYQIFKKQADYDYPEHLVSLLNNVDVPNYEKSRAENFLDLWVTDFRKMKFQQKNIYLKGFKKSLQKKVLSAYIQGREVAKLIGVIYQFSMQKWEKLTNYIQTSIESSQIQGLKLLWKISHSIIEILESLEQLKLANFLSRNFEDCLRKYKWKNHQQKIYLLQIVKHINANHVQKQFNQHSWEWTNKMAEMRAQKFISMKQQIGKNYIQLYQIESELANNHNTPSIVNNTQSRKKTASTSVNVQLNKKLQVNPFLLVKNEKEEAMYYQAELLKQILQCSPMLVETDKDFWIKMAIEFLKIFEQVVENLNKNRHYDILLCDILLGLLKLQIIDNIIRDNVNEKIVVPIIKNLDTKQSPFNMSVYSRIPDCIKIIFLTPPPNFTFQVMINRRIKSIIESGIVGKDDSVNRCIMELCCRSPLVLQKYQFYEIINVVTNLHKKRNILIQTYMILINIFLSGLDSPQATYLNFLLIFKTIPEMVENYVTEPGINTLRKITLRLFLKILKIMQVNEESEQLIIVPLINWLQTVELNFTKVYIPMIQIMSWLCVKFTQALRNIDMSKTENIFQGICIKIGQNPTQQHYYAITNSLILYLCKIQLVKAYHLYKELDKKLMPLAFQIQAGIIFKEQDIYEQKIKQNSKEKEKKHQILTGRLLKKVSLDLSSTMNTSRNEEKNIQNSQETEEESHYKQMKIRIGQNQLYWMDKLLTDRQISKNRPLAILQFNLLEQTILNGVIKSQDAFLIPKNLPNRFYQEILKQNDNKLLDMFDYLLKEGCHYQVFLFCSKFYSQARNYWMVISLKSYQFIRSRAFDILSINYNQNSVLCACSFFCGLLLPYANSTELKAVYDHLNKQQFVQNLYKGSDQFISLIKKYEQWFVVILMSFQLVQGFQKQEDIMSSFANISKTLSKWEKGNWEIQPELLPETESENMKSIVFDLSIEKYKTDVTSYYRRYSNAINFKLGKSIYKKQELIVGEQNYE